MEGVAHLGFIGLGTMGRDLLRAAAAVSKIKPSVLADPDVENLQQASALVEKEITTCTDYRKILEEGRLDGLVIAAPQHAHAEIAIASLQAGYHVFCEKPMGLNVIQCDAMISTAKESRKILMIGQVLRYINVYRYILELINSGALGKPLAMRTIRTMGKWGEWARPWRMRRATTGGMLLEVNVHEIDLMLCILGEAVSVQALGKRFINDEVDDEDFITFQVAFKNGTIGTCTSSSIDRITRNSGEVFCEKGTIYYDSVTSTLRVGRDGEDLEVLAYRDIHPEWEDGVTREIREFAEACLGERPVTIPGEDGLRAVEIGEAAYQSVQEGRVIHLPLPRN